MALTEGHNTAALVALQTGLFSETRGASVPNHVGGCHVCARFRDTVDTAALRRGSCPEYRGQILTLDGSETRSECTEARLLREIVTYM